MKLNIIKIVQRITKTLEVLSPQMAGWWACKLFFSPRTKRREAPAISNMQQNWLEYKTIKNEQGKCRVYTAGSGQTILLVHGWDGSSWSYTQLCNALIDAGFKVVLFDFPGHGLSSGNETNLVELREILRQLAKSEDNLHAIIGHSFGALAAGYAIKQQLPVSHFVSISAPVEMSFIVDTFCKTIGASNVTRQRLINKVESILKEPYERPSLTKNTELQQISGLIIHDRKDQVVPYSQAETLSSVWPDAKLLATKGLGHNRILRDSDVIKRIVEHLI